MRLLRIVAWIFVIAGSAGIANAGGGTALTYQGRLLDAGQPANGTFNVDFSLWDDPAVGSQIGSTISFISLPISVHLWLNLAVFAQRTGHGLQCARLGPVAELVYAADLKSAAPKGA